MDMSNNRKILNLIAQQEKELDRAQISKEKMMIQEIMDSDQTRVQNKSG
jgi:hypothetical protein